MELFRKARFSLAVFLSLFVTAGPCHARAIVEQETETQNNISQDVFIAAKTTNQPVAIQENNSKAITADWNFLVYIVSNNDLARFAHQNIAEMLQIGSNQNINILIQVDTYGKKEACRYYLAKNNPILMEVQTNNYQSISGTPENLFGFAQWGIKNFPAKHQALVLWDHGTGIEDPNMWGKQKAHYPHNMFSLNAKTGLMELNRKSIDRRGIGFNEVFQTYLTNQEIAGTLQKISQQLLGGKKLDILGMDACNMAMLEVGTQIKDSVDYMVGSQEVEPGSGWKYHRVLAPFQYQSLTPEQFCKQIVQAYKDAYQNTYTDYTQSSINLKEHSKLEINVDNVSVLLLKILQGQDRTAMIRNLKRIRKSLRLTTSFANKDYIDMHHFYQSLLDASTTIEGSATNKPAIKLLQNLLIEGAQLIEHNVVENITCQSLPRARGLSIYFPTKRIHNSYFKTIFAKNNNWTNFLDTYLKETQYSYLPIFQRMMGLTYSHD